MTNKNNVARGKKNSKQNKQTLAVARTIKGQGKYVYGDVKNMGPFEKIGRSLGTVVGRGYGGEPGAQLGAKLGSYLHYIGKIFGSGDYMVSPNSVKSNSLMTGTQIPQFGGSKSEVRIRHREYLGDIYTSITPGGFNISTYSINPGVIATFPWLSQVASSSYQQYRFNGLIFEYRSMSADALNSVNTALGTVSMATEYDSIETVFTTKAQMENTEFGVSCKPSSSMIHPIECARNQTSVSELYVRSGLQIPSNADRRLYDLGSFSIATTGFQGSNVNIGELWCSYDISFLKPIMHKPLINGLATHYNLAGTNALKPLLLDFSVNSVQPAFDNIGVRLTDSAAILPLSLPSMGYFMVTFLIRGASTTLGPPAIAFSGGLHNLGLFINNTSSGAITPSPGVAGTTILLQQSFYYDGSGSNSAPPTISFSTTATFPIAPLQGGDLWIVQVNGSAD